MKIIVSFLILLFTIQSCSQKDKTKDTDIKVSTKNFVPTEVEKTPVETKPKSKVGEFLEHYPNGNLKTEGWNNKEGKRDGVWYSYFESGLKWSVQSYKDGLKDGESIVYYPNGKKHYEGFYTNDKKSGHWKFYNENGDLETEKDY